MTSQSTTKPRPRRSMKERWAIIRRTFPDAVELARPQAKLWLLGLGLLLIGRLAGLTLPAAPKFLIDEVLPNQDYQLFGIIIGAVLAATVIQGLSSFALTQTISKAGQRLIADLRVKLHSHVSRLPTRYFDNHKTGEVVSRVMDDVEGVRNLLGTGMVELIGGLISAGITIVILFYLNWQLTIAILFCLAVFFALLIKAFMVLGPIFRERQEIKASISGRLTESVSGVRVVKAYNTEEIERGVFRGGVDRLLGNVLKTINAISLVALLTAVLLGVLGSVILYFGGRQMMAGEFTAGELFSYVAFLGFMIAPLSSIMMVGTQLSEAFAGIERMNEVLKELREDADEESREELGEMTGHVQFEDVSFEYNEGQPVLNGVSFQARPGSVTAIVGPSGSGKSTLIGLAASFHRPASGQILVDGHDLQSVKLSSYRAQLGVVLQENFLFDGTVRENIVYARPGASEEQIREAARLAHCLEFIEDFHDGFDTVIGERGVKVSGGQRQRLAIARAILANPRILILDEATSALDSESEAAIQEGLATLMHGRTTFVIAHRLSTIRSADQILVLEQGRILERGQHKELLQAGGRYYEMYTRQHGAEMNLFLAPGEIPNGPTEEPEGQAEKKRQADRLARLLSGE